MTTTNPSNLIIIATSANQFRLSEQTNQQFVQVYLVLYWFVPFPEKSWHPSVVIHSGTGVHRGRPYPLQRISLPCFNARSLGGFGFISATWPTTFSEGRGGVRSNFSAFGLPTKVLSGSAWLGSVRILAELTVEVDVEIEGKRAEVETKDYLTACI